MSRRGNDDDGAGVLSTFVGAVVFVVFMLFAAQLLLGLYLASIVGAVTYDAAKTAAGSDAPAQAVVTESARRQLGRFGDAAQFDWAAGDDAVRLTVTVPRPPLLPGFLPFVDDTITRTARVRAERIR